MGESEDRVWEATRFAVLFSNAVGDGHGGSGYYSVRMSGRKTALIITGCYALPTGYVLASTWYHTKPQYHGMDWIPISFLTCPGWGVLLLFPYGDRIPDSVAVLIGLVLNSGAIYLIVFLYKRWAEKLDKRGSTQTGTQI